MKTMEHVQNVLLNVPHVKLLQLVILALMLTEISAITVVVLLDFMMQVLTSVPHATQVVLHAQVLLPVPHVMLENSELLRIPFVSVKMVISNLFSKIKQKSVPNVVQNVRHVHNLPLNVLHVMLQSTESKVMIH